MANIVPILQQELFALEVALRDDPRYRKIERIKQLLADYGVMAEVDQEPIPVNSSPVAPPNGDATKMANARIVVVDGVSPPSLSTKRARVVAEITSILSERGQPVHRSEILERLVSKGLMGKEKNPMQALAVYMSGFHNFEGNGTGRWRITPRSGVSAEP